MPQAANPLDAAPPRAVELKPGESQWALIWREFRRRILAMISAGLIVLLVTIAIFAPFLANDRPLFYRGYNRFEYQEALRTMGAVVSNAAARITDEAAAGENPLDFAEDVTTIRRQAAVMAGNLPAESAAELQTLTDRITAALASPGAETAQTLRDARIELRRNFDSRQVTLTSGPHFPVFASLNGVETGFLILNLLFLLLPAWLPLVRKAISREHPAARNLATTAILVGIPIVCGLIWWLTVPERIDRTNYKAGVLAANAEKLDSAPVVYESVLWPAVPFGLDEDNLDAKYVPWAGRAPSDDGSPKPWAQPHWLGTDGIGRDVLSRMIWGGRVSLSVGIVAVSIYVGIGIIVGAIAGYFRGTADMLISRIIEIVICFPSFFLILTIVAFLGPSIFNIMIVIGLTGWTGVARLVRGEFLRLGEQEFVLASRALGYSPLRIIFRHVLPNAMAPVLVSATFGIAGAILTESALSFLGFGITVPTPSWGGILSTGRDAIFRAPWMIYVPGFAIFLTITAYNLVGEAFRDAADPRLRGQFLR